jgi:hypothetical protein
MRKKYFGLLLLLCINYFSTNAQNTWLLTCKTVDAADIANYPYLPIVQVDVLDSNNNTIKTYFIKEAVDNAIVPEKDSTHAYKLLLNNSTVLEEVINYTFSKKQLIKKENTTYTDGAKTTITNNYSYNKNIVNATITGNNEINTATYTLTPSGEKLNYRNIYKLNKAGNVVEKRYKNEHPKLGNIFKYTYTSDGKVKTETEYEGGKIVLLTTYNYTSFGKIKTIVELEKAGKKTKVIATTTYKYNKLNQCYLEEANNVGEPTRITYYKVYTPSKLEIIALEGLDKK